MQIYVGFLNGAAFVRANAGDVELRRIRAQSSVEIPVQEDGCETDEVDWCERIVRNDHDSFIKIQRDLVAQGLMRPPPRSWKRVRHNQVRDLLGRRFNSVRETLVERARRQELEIEREFEREMERELARCADEEAMELGVSLKFQFLDEPFHSHYDLWLLELEEAA